MWSNVRDDDSEKRLKSIFQFKREQSVNLFFHIQNSFQNDDKKVVLSPILLLKC